MNDNNESNGGMSKDEFEAFMKAFLANQNGQDPEALAEAIGLPKDPAALADLLKHLQNAMGASGLSGANPGESGVNWQLAANQAKTVAGEASVAIKDSTRGALHAAVSVGSLWLNAATAISELTSEPKLLSRELWVADAMPLFEDLANPVGNRMSTALSENLTQNAPEELASILGSATGLMKSAGGALFAVQLGQAIGKMSSQVISGGDIGLPLFKDQRAAFVPQNLDEFVAGLEVEPDQAYIYLAIREMAHARLFKHSKWLRDAVVSQIAKYASEITIDNDRVTEMTQDFDPNNMDELREALETGAFIADRTQDQQQALDNIETLLALIEGWVDVVTEESTKLLPKSAAIGEAVRRRRATGGPAELTFGTLVGLELRPRKLREATALWREITNQLGIEKRDDLWNHPDLVPTAEDIADPHALISRLQNSKAENEDFDQALRDLLGDN